MTDEDLALYRRLLSDREDALTEAHHALRPNAPEWERQSARAVIETVLPRLAT